jgi:predicted DNA-binding protein (UPF0251 family)
VTLQMAPDASTPPTEVHSLITGRTYEQLDVEDHLLILRLADKDLPQTEIAKRLGCSQATVSRSLKKHRLDTSQLAIGRAKASVLNAVDRAIDIAEKGANDDTALKAVKLVAGIAGIVHTGQQVTVNNAVIIGQPGKPETLGPDAVFGEVIEAKVNE